MFFDFFTAGAGWVLASVISATLLAGLLLVNQYAKQPGNALVFYQRVLVVMLLSPVMVVVNWPENPLFYAAVFGTAVLGGLSDIRTYNVASQFGGGAVARITPLAMFTTFPAWFFFDHALLQQYLGHPFKTLGILATIGMIGFFAMRLKKSEVSSAALKAMLPALGGYTCAAVLNKIAMRYGPQDGVVFCYIYVQSLIVAGLIGGYIFVQGKRKVINATLKPNRKLFITALLMAGFWLGSMVFKNTSMLTIPHPSYHTAINQLSPVFIAVFYRVTKHREEGDVMSGFGIVLCAIILSLLAR